METKVYLTHGDLLPRSILIEGFEINGRLPDIFSSSGNIAGCMIWDGRRLHVFVFSPANSLVRVRRGRSKPYLESSSHP